MTNKYKKEFDEEIGQSLTPEQIVKIHNANKKMIRKFNQDYNKMVDESEEEIQKLKEEIQKLKDDYQKLLKKLGGVRASRKREKEKFEKYKEELSKYHQMELSVYTDKHLKATMDYQHFCISDLHEILRYLVGDNFYSEFNDKIEKLIQKRYQMIMNFTGEVLEDTTEKTPKELIQDICKNLSRLSEKQLKQFKEELDERLKSDDFPTMVGE